MAMGPRDNRNVGIFTIIAAIVITSVSVADQESNCPNGCISPNNLPNLVSFKLTGNFINDYELSSNCFPFNTTLLYVCKEKDTHQFKPTHEGNLLSRKCTGSGWLDDNDHGNWPPKCVKREKHCFPPPIVPNVFVQIDNLNVSGYSDVNPERSYSESTIATYKCINPELAKVKEVQQTRRCIKENDKIKKRQRSPTIDSWKWTESSAKDSSCDVSETRNDSTVTKTTAANNDSTTTKTTAVINTKPAKLTNNDAVDIDIPYQQQTATQRNIIIGICGFVALILISTLIGVCYKNRLMLSKRCGDGVRYGIQPSFALTAEEQSKRNETDGQDLLYANIIPIKVNSETIYAEIQTGRIRGNGEPVKCTIRDDQLQTIYAEIHHSK